jgi:predicted Zn-dependent peptidase
VPVRPVVTEPDLTAERRDSFVDPLAPLPAFASAWRVPDPAADLRGYLAYLVLCLLLTDSALGRLTRRLARRDHWVSSVDCGLGLTGEVFGVRDPTCLVLTASPVPGGPGTDAILKAVDDEIERLATEGPSPAELTAATRTISAQLVRVRDGLAGRARLLTVFALQHGDAGVINELGPLSRAVTAADVRAAAATLRPQRRATVELHPGAAAHA